MKIAAISGALLLVLLGTAPSQASAQSSCQEWHDQCAAMCRRNVPRNSGCVFDICEPEFARCRQTGCWREPAYYGGHRHCGLHRS